MRKRYKIFLFIPIMFCAVAGHGQYRTQNISSDSAVTVQSHDTLSGTTAALHYCEQLTLQSCIENAMRGNFDILIGENEVEIARNNVTLTPFLPTINASAKNTHNISGSGTYNAHGERANSNSNLMNYSAGANLSWTLFDGLRMFATRSIQEQLLAGGELAFRGKVENLTKNICSQYYLIISLQNQESLLEQLVETSRIRYNQALLRYNIGKDSGLEFKQAKIDLNSDSSSLLTQRENLSNAYIELYRMINIPLNSKHIISDTIEMGEHLLLEQLQEGAQLNNTSILRSRKGEKIAELDLKTAQSARYPSLSAGSGYNYQYNQSPLYTSKYNDVSGFNWGLTLSVPVFSGLETNRRIKNARIEQNSARLTVLQTEQNVMASLLQLYNTYLNNVQLTAFETESAEVAAINLEAATARYKIGSISGIQYRDIQISYLNAADRKLKALYQAKLSEIQLLLLAGDLSLRSFYTK